MESWWQMGRTIRLIVASVRSMALADVIITDDVTVAASDVHSDIV
jgi:hypothetical protein